MMSHTPEGVEYIDSVLLPVGPGDSTQWTRIGAPTNWQAVGEQTIDTTTLVRVAPGGDGLIDLYSLGEIRFVERIQSVIIAALAQTTLKAPGDPDPTIKLMFRNGPVTVTGPTIAVPSAVTTLTFEVPVGLEEGDVPQVGIQCVSTLARVNLYREFVTVRRIQPRSPSPPWRTA